jgi:hypothetical protein
MRDIFALPEFGLAADGIVGMKIASPKHFSGTPLQPRELAYIPGFARI